MTLITCTYKGNGETNLVHGPTGAEICTDLPPDNGGKGRRFSPTDLLTGALVSCILTIMGKMAEVRGEKLDGAEIAAEKIMAANPRRVGAFVLKIKFPAHFTEEQKAFYQTAVQACPVHKTLHPDVKTTVEIL